MSRFRAILAAALFAMLSGPGVAAEPLLCPRAPFSVLADDPSLSARTCASAEWATARLAACGLTCAGRVEINVSDDPVLPWDGCLASYDCEAGTVEIASPRALDRLILRDGPFAGIAPLTLFDSLVAHEIVHVCLNPILDPRSEAIATAEYAPCALQMAALPPQDRQRILGRYTLDRRVVLDDLQPFILLFEPALFAGRAWTHFSGPDGGCDFLRALAAGRVRLPLLPPNR